MLVAVQSHVSISLAERFAGVHESMWMQDVVPENALQRAVNHRCIQHVLQFGNTGQHIVSHVEFPGVVPLDLVEDPLMHGGFDVGVEHEYAIADKPPNLFVVQFDALAFHSGFPTPTNWADRCRSARADRPAPRVGSRYGTALRSRHGSFAQLTSASNSGRCSSEIASRTPASAGSSTRLCNSTESSAMS